MKVELLAPAGDFEKLRAAVLYGADACYFAPGKYSLRAAAGNFDREELKDAINYLKSRGKKGYIALNTYPRDEEKSGLIEMIEYLESLQADGAIVSDLGVFSLVKKYAPHMEIHISTQANTVNSMSANAWYDLGAKRIILARELSLKEIEEIRKNTPDDLALEAFVHGAMCISYSGRCLLSAFLANRDPNRGDCAQSCRWKYFVREEKRPGEYFEMEEDSGGTFLFNSKDLCMIEYIPEMIDAGIDSFKIEGRMKTALYVATVARTYRRAIDDYFVSEERYRSNLLWYREEIAKCTYRQFTTGFYFGKPDETTQIYDHNTYVKEYVYLGIVGKAEEDGSVTIEQRNKFSVGEEIEVMKPEGANVPAVVLSIQDEEGNEQDSAPHPKQVIRVRLAAAGPSAEGAVDTAVCAQYDILRKKEEESE